MGQNWAENGMFFGFLMLSCSDMKGYDVATWLHVAVKSVLAVRVMS